MVIGVRLVVGNVVFDERVVRWIDGVMSLC